MASSGTVNDADDAANQQRGLALRKTKKKGSRENLFTDPAGNPLPKEILNSVTLFTRKQKKGIIDVWWLYDDGGSIGQLSHS